MGLGLVLIGMAAGGLGAILAFIYGGGLWLALGVYAGFGCGGTLAAAGLVALRATPPQPRQSSATLPNTLPVTPVPQSQAR